MLKCSVTPFGDPQKEKRKKKKKKKRRKKKSTGFPNFTESELENTLQI